MALSTKSTFMPFVVIGLIVSSALGILYQYDVHATLVFLWLSLFGFMFLFAVPTARSISRLCFSTLIVSFGASIPFDWQAHALHYFSFSSMMLAVINAYALNAFHLNYQTNRFHFSYETLFFAVWDTFVQLLITFFFTLLCWGILQLSASLFSLLGITFLKTAISKLGFDIACTGFFVSMGLFITIQTQHIVRQIRGILLLVCRYLLIPLAIIGIIFVIASLITLTQHNIILNQIELLSVAFLCVLFVNGVYQDGHYQLPYSPILLKLCTVFLWITPIFSALSLYSVINQGDNNIAQNGINLGNFAYLINILLLLSYNIVYAVIAVLHKKIWLVGIQKANIVLAIVLIGVTLTTINPVVLNQLTIPKNNWRTQTRLAPQEKSAELTTVFTRAGFAWKPMHNHLLPTDALVLGYDLKPIYFCRAHNDNHYVGGVLNNNTCNVINDNHITAQKSFEILSGPTRKVSWRHAELLSTTELHRTIIIIAPADKPRCICRLIYDNHIVIGTSSGFNRCTFIYDGNIVNTDASSALAIATYYLLPKNLSKI